MRFIRPSALRCTSLIALAACAALVACAATPAPASHLPIYGAEAAALLDDGLSGHLFETAFVPGVAGDDAHFEDRVRAAESVWHVKVATVSRSGSLGDNRRYDLAFRVLEVLAGPAPTSPVALSISGRDPAFHWLDRTGGAWVGHELLLFVRHYRSHDQPVLHFHGEPVSPELRTRIGAIRTAMAAEARQRAALRQEQ